MSDYVGGRKKLDVGTRQRSSRETPTSSSDMSVYNTSDEGTVRYKESMESSVYKSSQELFEHSCDPCNSVGDHLEAEGFCADCGEYLCGAYFRSHSRGKATKNHKLLTKDNMPKRTVKICDPCKTAGEEEDAVGYCGDCEEYMCSSCFRSHSRSKATKHHNLMSKDNMPEKSDSDLASSIAKINIFKGDRTSQMYDENYTYVRDISLKVEGDKEDCYITAMIVVSNNEIVLADNDNRSLKRIDVDNNKTKDTLGLQAVPFGLSSISSNELAVGLPGLHMIQIVTLSGTLSVAKAIKTSGQCLDIDYIGGRLYASFIEPLNIQILKPTGTIRKTIKLDSQVLQQCTFPRHIVVGHDEKLLYVSDWKSKKVMCVDIDGNFMSVYHDELQTPVDITIAPSGEIYLCDKGKSTVYKMTPDLNEATVILGPGDGLSNPQAICYNAEKQHVYISSGADAPKSCNYIKVFKWQ